MLSHFSRVRLCATPETAAHQAPPSLGFSRPEHWSGLPFPSPMHESEKWKWNCSVVSDSSWPHGLEPTRPLHPWDFPGKSTGVGCHCPLPSKDTCVVFRAYLDSPDDHILRSLITPAKTLFPSWVTFFVPGNVGRDHIQPSTGGTWHLIFSGCLNSHCI